MRTQSILCALGTLLLLAVAAAAATSIDGEQGGRTGSRALLATARCPKNAERNFQHKCVCKPGYELYKSDKKCHSCQAGYYKPKRGSGRCLPCPSGWYIAKRGALKCLKCFSGFVNPKRTKCQLGCKRRSDHSVIHFGPFWSVDWHVYFRGGVSNKLTAAQVCDNVRYDGAKNLIPAVIKSNAQAKVAAKLAEFHFACERKPAGQPNFDYAYFAWIGRGWQPPVYPPPGQCSYLFHTKGAIGDGSVSTLLEDQCIGNAGELLPVLCTKGCARFCKRCGSPGKCAQCVDGYTSISGTCKKVTILPL